jgi:hypothetical protein
VRVASSPAYFLKLRSSASARALHPSKSHGVLLLFFSFQLQWRLNVIFVCSLFILFCCVFILFYFLFLFKLIAFLVQVPWFRHPSLSSLFQVIVLNFIVFIHYKLFVFFIFILIIVIFQFSFSLFSWSAGPFLKITKPVERSRWEAAEGGDFRSRWRREFNLKRWSANLIWSAEARI